MSHTSLCLNGWAVHDWPESVDVFHEGARDGRRYVPEQTCSWPIVEDEEEKERRAGLGPGVFIPQDVPLCRKCTNCGKQWTPTAEIPKWVRFCPNCGARLVEP